MIARTAPPAFAPSQHGTALLVSMIILLVLSLLAVAMAKSAILEGRVTSSVRSAQLAQLAADSAMSEARATIARIAARDGAKAVCAALRCAARPAGAPGDPAVYMQTPSARAAAIAFRVDLAKPEKADATAQVAATPVYVVEDLGTEVPPPGSPSRRHLFRVTAKGTGGSDDFTRVVESVYAVAEEDPPSK